MQERKERKTEKRREPVIQQYSLIFYIEENTGTIDFLSQNNSKCTSIKKIKAHFILHFHYVIRLYSIFLMKLQINAITIVLSLTNIHDIYLNIRKKLNEEEISISDPFDIIFIIKLTYLVVLDRTQMGTRGQSSNLGQNFTGKSYEIK